MMQPDPRIEAEKSPQLVWDALAMSGTTTYRSEKFSLARMSVFSVHMEGSSITAWTSAFTLWVSNKPNPDPLTDTDWIDLDSDRGFTGLPKGDPSAETVYKEGFDVGVAGWLWGRLKFVNATNGATISAWVNRKRG